jgi:acetyl esterase/lipase
MPLDPAAKHVIDMLEELMPRVEHYESADDVRAFMLANRRELPEPDAVARVEHHVAPGADGAGVVVRVYWPSDDETLRPGIVFFHGGGWVIGDLESHDGACRRLATALDAVVVATDYRRAPEHKFPAAVDDCYGALRWAAEHAAELKIDAARLAVAGDSAGGNLAAAVALMARDRSGPPLVYQLLVYPVIDSTAGRNDYPSKVDNATGYFLHTDSMEWYRTQYLASEADGDDPYCSPNAAASLAGLPPACIVTAEYDPLRDEGEAYGAQLEAAGVDVVVHRAPGVFHGFFNMDAVLDGAKVAQQVAFDAMRPVLHGDG